MAVTERPAVATNNMECNLLDDICPLSPFSLGYLYILDIAVSGLSLDDPPVYSNISSNLAINGSQTVQSLSKSTNVGNGATTTTNTANWTNTTGSAVDVYAWALVNPINNHIIAIDDFTSAPINVPDDDIFSMALIVTLRDANGSLT